MSRFGYLFAIAIVIALGVYVFRPSSAPAVQWQRVFTGSQAADYELLANGLHQQVRGKRVQLAGVTLPLSSEVAGALWNQWTVLSAPSDKFVEGVGAADLASYGIDPTVRRLWGQGFDFSWGASQGEGYVIDRLTGRLASVGVDLVKRLDRLAGRLDAGNPLPSDVGLAAVECGATRLIRRDIMWGAINAPMRPDFRVRVETAMRLVQRVRIAQLQAAEPAGATAVGTLRIELDAAGAAQAGMPAAYDYRVWKGQAGGWIGVNDLPVQTLSAEELVVWEKVIASFAEDRLFNLGDTIMTNPIERVLVERAGKPWFSLESSSGKDLDDFASKWDVVWDGGREFAAPESAFLLQDALNDLAVTDVRVRLALEEDWPDAVRITLLGKALHGEHVLEMRGTSVRTASHVGRVVRRADVLERLAPDRFLDTMIAGRSPERVLKIQRRFLDRDPAAAEVLSRDARGGWVRSWPAGEPVDPVSVERIARVFATGRAASARMADESDRAIAASPEFEIAVRFGPKPSGKANDFTELEDTTTNDLGLAMRRSGDGRWRALQLGTGIAYDLDDEFVQQLRQGVSDPLVLPLIPALVRRVQLASGDESLLLARSGEDWRLQQGDQDAPAAAVEVRRLLRDLAGLVARRRGAGGALAPSELAVTISIEIPGFDREVERLVLQIGKPGMAGAAADEVALFAESTRPGSLASGRAFATVASVAAFTADPARFR